MAQDVESKPEALADVQLESGTYEIIRNRLSQQGKELRERLDQLNEARKEVFGSIETKLLSTERITTANNCIPRDMVAIGKRFIFGYNVRMGLKTETTLADVFAIYEFRDGAFRALPLDLIQDARFEKDFRDVYRFYKQAVFAKFSKIGPFLFMVFQVGKTASDIKTFKWAIEGDSLVYVDNRSDHEFQFPPQHDFQWIRTTRDLHRQGEHPHISIDDRVFVETVGGDLTIKIENNTESGEGIYAEDVENKDQTLDDAEIYYAIVGNLILLKIRPYQEQAFRYFVFNEKIQKAIRLDSIAHACVLLPDDHGIIFSNGYYLQRGESKIFESGLTDMLFEKRLVAPNGEDYLYTFYNRETGDHVLLRYNLIQQQVDTPILCNGAAFFQGGELVCFKAQQEPQKHHAVQIWQTPYVSEDFVPETNTDSFLYKIGNRDLVRGMAECHEILNLIAKEETYADLYVDIAKLAGDITDAYFWIGNPDCFNPKETLESIRSTATAAIDEFEKVVRLRQNTAAETKRVKTETREILSAVLRKRFDKIDDFVTTLADLRAVRGEIISLRELRYVDLELVDELEQEVVEQAEKQAQRCVKFLLDPKALNPYTERVESEAAKIETLQKVSDAKRLEENIAASAGELEMLIEIVSNLKIDDATHRTAIIDNISVIFASVNTARAALKGKIRELMSVEGVAEFNSQMKLLNQGVVNYLDICDQPEKCDEFLTKVMIQLEELEGRFAEFDEFVVQLTEKREEVYNAFETRKLQLVEARNKRANSLMSAADRILKGIKARVEAMDSINDINGYFASDLMIEKVRDIVRQLEELDDSVKVDDIQSRLKTVREDAVRQLKDRQELFVDGEMVIRFGKNKFSVNVQQLDLTTVIRDDDMCLHLTGTNFFEPLTDESLLATRDVWDQEVVSENREVYRGEYLAYQLFKSLSNAVGSGQPAEGGAPEEAVWTLDDARAARKPKLRTFIQRFMGPRYNEAYSKGVHDNDALLILRGLLDISKDVGLLRFSTRARALATMFWRYFGDEQEKALINAKLSGFGAVARLFPDAAAKAGYVSQLESMIDAWLEQSVLFDAALVFEAAEYLFRQNVAGGGFVISRTAADLNEAFQIHLRQNSFDDEFRTSLESVSNDPISRVQVARDWVAAFLDHRGKQDELEYADEVVATLLEGDIPSERIVDAKVNRTIKGLVGTHPVVDKGVYQLNYNRFMTKLNRYEREVVPRYHAYIDLKKQLVDDSREAMRLDEFRPRVLTSFVRNKLIDEVYLPLIGDNLAKQIGVAGEAKRTDRMGLLLLISPPGYGKTTLMEYIANRLGIIFMKINGPAIGHRVTSLDPVEAPNAAAREELLKLNLSLEMGDNVMIYLDDIQHCNPEFLQKFISLCDAQRKIEGVYKGRTRTYDLRGRKVCVVMAGNPYTESGEKFQIPDMLSNRADIYNLGEIIGETQDVFEMSYLENCLTSNPALNKLATRSQKDVYSIIRMADLDTQEGIELEGNYALEEINELVATMKKLMRVRDVVLRVNQAYIASAAQSDDYRTEPPFLLQGSYRNMNRIAEKVLPIMNNDELESLIMSNYENDAQTLTTSTESNLLKLKDMLGKLEPEEAKRWASIRRTFQQNVKMRGVEADDQVGQVILQLREFSDGLNAIREAMTDGVQSLSKSEDDKSELHLSMLLQHVAGLRSSLDTIGEAVNTAATKPPEPLRIETAAPPALPPQKVIVQHKVPRSILEVLRSQFDVINNWLQPLANSANAHTDDMKRLENSVQTCLANYYALLQELEDARRTGDEPPIIHE